MNSSKLFKVKRKLGPTDQLIYECGIVALGIVIAAVLLYFLFGINLLNIKYTCLFNKITHLPCPGCGGTRSVKALLHGRFVKSLYYYPPVVYAALVYVIFMSRCILYKYFGIGKLRDGVIEKYMYFGIALIIIQWIVKLVAQLVFGYAWLG